MRIAMTGEKAANDGGFALFAVLSFLLLAAAVVSPLVSNARSQALIARNVANELKDRFLLDGLILLAGREISKRSKQPDFTLAKFISCPVGPSTVQFMLQDHAGLIDLNAASSDLLRIGFLAGGFKPETAQELAHAVLRYRSVEPLAGLNDSISVSGGMKGRLFESVDELDDFQISEKAAALDYRNIFTVRTRTGTIQENAIPEPIDLVLKHLPPDAAYFFASGGPQIAAVKLTVSVARPGQPLLGANVDIGPNAAIEFVKLSQPRHARGRDGSPQTSPSRANPNCADLFDGRSQDAIQYLLGKDVEQ